MTDALKLHSGALLAVKSILDEVESVDTDFQEFGNRNDRPGWKTQLQLLFFKLKNMDTWRKRRSFEDLSTSEESGPGQKRVTPPRNPPRFGLMLDHLPSRSLNSLARHHHQKADSDLSVSGKQHPIQAWRMKRCKGWKDHIVLRGPEHCFNG